LAGNLAWNGAFSYLWYGYYKLPLLQTPGSERLAYVASNRYQTLRSNYEDRDSGTAIHAIIIAWFAAAMIICFSLGGSSLSEKKTKQTK
jgi:hypothetical protein